MRTEKLNSYDLKSHRKNFCTRKEIFIIKDKFFSNWNAIPHSPKFSWDSEITSKEKLLGEIDKQSRRD